MLSMIPNLFGFWNTDPNEAATSCDAAQDTTKMNGHTGYSEWVLLDEEGNPREATNPRFLPSFDGAHGAAADNTTHSNAAHQEEKPREQGEFEIVDNRRLERIVQRKQRRHVVLYRVKYWGGRECVWETTEDLIAAGYRSQVRAFNESNKSKSN